MKYWRSYENKHHAEIVSDYVNKTLTMFSHYPTKVREKIEGEKFVQKWVIEIEHHCSQYTITLEQASNAATDFLNGYEFALHEPAPQWRKK
jgi:hypothetical protein